MSFSIEQLAKANNLGPNSTIDQAHPIHKQTGIEEFDVFIAGSGPVGATYARLLVDAGFSVIMTEIGDQDTLVPGAHKKNEIEYQKDIDRFVNVIKAALSPVSVPVRSSVVPSLDPAAWFTTDPAKMFVSNGKNPRQEIWNNLGAEAVTRGVGGMSTHWTCATPRFLRGLERPQIFKDEEEDDDEWDLLYSAAEALIGTSDKEFNRSIRHNTVLDTLKKAYPNRGVKPLPLACHRLIQDSPYVQWHAADNVYGDMFINPKKKNKEGKERGRFSLITNTRCTRFALNMEKSQSGTFDIFAAEVRSLTEERYNTSGHHIPVDSYIRAKVFVTAAGAVANPQILFNSGFNGWDREKTASAPIPHLATHITEQTMTFCQVVMSRELVDGIAKLDDKPQWWKDAVEKHLKDFGKTDPLPIPFKDPEPQVTIPASIERPWHTQIHRDAFSYGEVGPTVDSRVVVDLRFFGMQEGVDKNKIVFEKDITDAYGMPQPTFQYLPTLKNAEDAHRMMNDMTDVANKIGGYLPGSEPQFMTPGLALHLGGTTRLGHRQAEVTTANFNSQVWNFNNLYVAGNGTIPTSFGANPTLTSICLAMRSAHKIATDLKKGVLTPARDNDTLHMTPKSWLNWAFDKTDPNFPHHTDKRPHTVVGQFGNMDATRPAF